MSGFAFSSPGEAVAAITARLHPVGTESVPLEAAAGRVLAADLRADRPSPAIDVSAMDGYAVRLGEVGRGRLRIAGDCPAGSAPRGLEPGSVLRIATGAPAPMGAEAVIRREDVREGEGWIEVEEERAASLRSGENIRRRGENIAEGATVARAGREITPAIAGALATFGVAHPLVHRRVRTAVLVTGDEVLPPDATPEPWQLRDSNGPAVMAMLGGCRWVEARLIGRSVDRAELIREQVEAAIAMSDALVITGGVSMGERDWVPRVVAELGAEMVFHKLPQRPGKPVLGAVFHDGDRRVPILALPGNPVSVMVTGRRMLMPILAALGGIAAPDAPETVRLRPVQEGSDLAGGGPRVLDLWWHRPVRLIDPGVAELVTGMGSGDIAAAARSDGFIEVPPGRHGEGPWPFYRWSR